MIVHPTPHLKSRGVHPPSPRYLRPWFKRYFPALELTIFENDLVTLPKHKMKNIQPDFMMLVSFAFAVNKLYPIMH